MCDDSDFLDQAEYIPDYDDLLFNDIMSADNSKKSANAPDAKKDKKLSRDETITEIESTGKDYTGIHPDTFVYCGDSDSYTEIIPVKAEVIAEQAGIDVYEVMYCGEDYAKFTSPQDELYVLNQHGKSERLTGVKFTEMRPTLRIPLENGAVIKCGIHQLFLVKKSGKQEPDWIRAKDICEGDEILSLDN